mgnify:CR=1 FL=1
MDFPPYPLPESAHGSIILSGGMAIGLHLHKNTHALWPKTQVGQLGFPSCPTQSSELGNSRKRVGRLTETGCGRRSHSPPPLTVTGRSIAGTPISSPHTAHSFPRTYRGSAGKASGLRADRSCWPFLPGNNRYSDAGSLQTGRLT